MTVNLVLNVILPSNNDDSIPPLEPQSQGIKIPAPLRRPAIRGLISPRKATLRSPGAPADPSCSSASYLSKETTRAPSPACHSPATAATAHINKGNRGLWGFCI